MMRLKQRAILLWRRMLTPLPMRARGAVILAVWLLTFWFPVVYLAVTAPFWGILAFIILIVRVPVDAYGHYRHSWLPVVRASWSAMIHGEKK